MKLQIERLLTRFTSVQCDQGEHGDKKIADKIHVSSMRPRRALKLGIEKIADKIHVSSMRLRGALKLGIKKIADKIHVSSMRLRGALKL
ncbi:hypothetical protein [Lactococcus lactis]|uniref:hypothetical protein n=1 Tax=Lactococcus lactis TaxID=1358 RepID=UPI000C9F63EC|nr:hypothetical protein [Lactococcus lactis]AUS69001.1 hypothetical protein LLG50_02570 [Lactococcus lactis subsp. lactis]